MYTHNYIYSISRVVLYIYNAFPVQVLCLEKSLEEMLTRVDEFVGMLDMVRSMSLHLVAFSVFTLSTLFEFFISLNENKSILDIDNFIF